MKNVITVKEMHKARLMKMMKMMVGVLSLSREPEEKAVQNVDLRV